MKRTTILLALLLLTLPLVAGIRSESIELLTVAENENNTATSGGTATMNLQISPGDGNVFIDSYPLTQLDTQISTRFAKEVACDYTNRDCDEVNFYYTIRASSSVVGGPSAGAAASVLTSALLNNESLEDKTVITGTINSGGYIGPVGGIDEKIEAATAKGFNTVIIPKYSTVNGETLVNESTINDDIKTETVTQLDEAYEAFTGIPTNHSNTIDVNDEYNKVMGSIARDLCRRNDELLADAALPSNTTVYNQSVQAKQNAQDALRDERYYSAASYCFTANIDLRETILANRSEEERTLVKQGVIQDARAMLDRVQDHDIQTISDVEASIIVKERLYEVLDDDVQDRRSTAYLVERLDSARAWESFFNYSSPAIELDEDYLRDACLSKRREAEERVRYLDFFLETVDRYEDDLDDIEQTYREGDYTYCLFQASQLKADANSVITGRGIDDQYQSEYVSDKLRIARQQIANQESFFPILGYSYYTYADDLQDEQPNLAAVFSEYAAEFGALDMYFENTDTQPVPFPEDAQPTTCPVPEQTSTERTNPYLLLGIGAFIGMLVIGVIRSIQSILKT
jgi:uncharacterized protein